MDLKLSGKVALIAAASDGLGLATAKQLLKEGAKIAICGREQTRLQEAEETLSKLKNKEHVLALQCDVTDAKQIQQFIQATIDQFQQLDIVITNAGGPPAGTFATTNTEDYEKAFQLTLMSTVHLITQALPYLKKSDAASILTITSYLVKQPQSNLLLSNIIRPAVIGLTKSLSQELGNDNIRVNSILPGWTQTQRTVYLLEKQAAANGVDYATAEKLLTENIPLKRMATVEEFANVATFLVSSAASYITGTMLQVDGGLMKGLF